MLPKYFKPEKEYDLTRLGQDNDGGYLVEKKSIENSKSLITLGLGYDWSFENEKGPNDVLVDGILLVDKMYELYVIGMELDYRYDDFESAFVFNNPKATSSCGCGTSFSV